MFSPSPSTSVATGRSLSTGSAFAPDADTKVVVTINQVKRKTLALVGCFETSRLPPDCFSAVSGNFDGQGVSFGALQFNLGQGTLQPIIIFTYKNDPQGFKRAFADGKDDILLAKLRRPKAEQVAWASSISVRGKLASEWADVFERFGCLEACRVAQIEAAEKYYSRAVSYCRQYDLKSERAYALMFDIAVQNGSIKKTAIKAIGTKLPVLNAIPDPKTREWEIMKAAAHAVAEASNPRWIEDVRSRKLCIANGVGIVHGQRYDLAKQFDITMRPWG